MKEMSSRAELFLYPSFCYSTQRYILVDRRNYYYIAASRIRFYMAHHFSPLMLADGFIIGADIEIGKKNYKSRGSQNQPPVIHIPDPVRRKQIKGKRSADGIAENQYREKKRVRSGTEPQRARASRGGAYTASPLAISRARLVFPFADPRDF